MAATTIAQFIGSGSEGIIGVINTVVVPLIVAFSFAAFVYGVVQYFFINGDNETKREEGKQFVLWGLIAMAIMFSVWGFVSILLSTLGIAPVGR